MGNTYIRRNENGTQIHEKLLSIPSHQNCIEIPSSSSQNGYQKINREQQMQSEAAGNYPATLLVGTRSALTTVEVRMEAPSELKAWGLEGCSAVKSTCHSCKGPGLGSQHLSGDFQLFSTPVPGTLMPPSGLLRREASSQCAYTCAGKTATHL